MADEPLSMEDRKMLLSLAHQAIERAAHGAPMADLDLENLPSRLREPGACFVTLTTPDGRLRGCIGGLEARLPLAEDVYQHACAAAFDDYRFAPVTAGEAPYLHIEISRLTPTVPLEYDRPQELLTRLRPLIDGVVLHDGPQRATFLPQVWEKLPDPSEFLSQLCLKMGAPADLWQHKKLVVEIYHVEEFHD